MKNSFSTNEYRGKVYIPHLDIHSDVVLVLDEYLLHGFQELNPERRERWDILYGEFEELGKVTFLDCFQVLYLDNRTRFTGAIQFIKFFSGRHLLDQTDKFISSVRLSSGALNEWFCEDQQVLQDNYHISTSNALPIVNIGTGNLTIIIDCNQSLGSDTGNAIDHIAIQMLFSKPVSVYEFASLRHKLQNLVLFLTNEDPELNLLNYNDSELFGMRKFQYFDRDWFSDAIEFSFIQISKELELIVRYWFENDKLDNVRDLLLERKYNPDLSKGRYFLNMCIALESFHRRFINDKVSLTDNSVVENRERIKNYLQEDTELLKWFKTKSAFWNSPTLYDRLIDLKEEYNVIVGDLFQQPIEDVIRNVKKCRDRLAHDGEYEMVFQEEIELFLVGYSLEMLLYVLLFKHHGIKEVSLIFGLQLRAHGNLKELCVMNDYPSLVG